MPDRTKIQQFLVLFVGVLLVLHATVPHHHHSNCSGQPGDNHRNYENYFAGIGQPQQSSAHCHVLNSLEPGAQDNYPKTPFLIVCDLLVGEINAFSFLRKSAIFNITSNYFLSSLLPKASFETELSFRGPPIPTYNILAKIL